MNAGVLAFLVHPGLTIDDLTSAATSITLTVRRAMSVGTTS